MPNNNLKVTTSRSPSAAVSRKDSANDALTHLLKYISPKYLNGKNPIARAQTGYGFLPAKNAALNMGALLGQPYDPKTRIRPGDPAVQLRDIVKEIGLIERIHNTYVPGRGVKLAD